MTNEESSSFYEHFFKENSIETVTIYTSLYHYDAGKCGVVFPQQVLRKTSDYFKKCLDSGMIESSTGKIRMGDIELTTIQDFRIWLMTNSFRFFPDGFIYPYFADGGKQDINGRLIQLAFFGHRILCPALEHAAIKAFWDWQLWGELEDDGRPWDIEDLLREVYENTPERYILRRVMAFIATMHVFRLQEKQESAMGLFRKLGTHYGEFSADMFIARDILASKDHLSSLSWKGIALDFTWDNFKSNYLEREAWKVLVRKVNFSSDAPEFVIKLSYFLDGCCGKYWTILRKNLNDDSKSVHLSEFKGVGVQPSLDFATPQPH